MDIPVNGCTARGKAMNQQGGNKPGDIPYIVWLRTVIHILYYGAQNAGSSSG
jgi:hypothetical protein